MAIHTDMSGKGIDMALREIANAENEENNGKVLYIYQGHLAFAEPITFFDVAVLVPED